MRAFWLWLAGLGIFLAPQIAQARAANLPIIVYHQILESVDEDSDDPTIISYAQFSAQMAYLHDHGYVTLSMDEVMRYLNGEPFPERVVAIQFDDGWKSQLSALSLLRQYGFKATFWVIAGATHDPDAPHLNWMEIQRLAKNPSYGLESHTMTHPWKANDTLVDWVEGRTPGQGVEQAMWELTESKKMLEAKVGRPVRYLAWPAGYYDEKLVQLAKKAGYVALLNCDSGFIHPGDDAMHLPRIMIDGRCTQEDFENMLQDGWARNCPKAPQN